MRYGNWSDFKYDIADFFFCKQMDEAYSQGIRIGAEFATRKISFEVNLKRQLDMTKTEERGYNLAIDAVERTKSEITRSTGAMF